jgi:hypothetical protein
MKRLASAWLEGQELKKSSTEGMGAALVGPSVFEIVSKVAAVVMVCVNKHETTIGAAPDSGRCATCKRKLAVKDSTADSTAGDVVDEDEMDPAEEAARGVMTKSVDLDEVAAAVEQRLTRKRTGGMLDGRPIYEQQHKSRASIDSPRGPVVRD